MTSPDFSRTVYYLPGHGGQLHTGLGEGLLSRGWQVTGRATVGNMLGTRLPVDRLLGDLEVVSDFLPDGHEGLSAVLDGMVLAR